MNKFSQKGFVNFILIVVVIILIVIVGYLALAKKTEPITQLPTLPKTTTLTKTSTSPMFTSILKNETATWKRYTWKTSTINSKNSLHFTIKYPLTLRMICPPQIEAGCFLGSLQLGNQYYSADDVPAGAIAIIFTNYGVEDTQAVTNLYQWRKNWTNGLNASATYLETTINGRKVLEERTAKDVTVYVSTGTGRVLSFIIFPSNPTNEKLFNSILETLTITKITK